MRQTTGAQPPVPGPRIAVLGVTGSGKTTTARRLARILGIQHIELDALNWQPGWQQVKTEIFRERVTKAIAGPAWVTDGNYSKARDLIWGHATTLVWLDYPLLVVLWQLFSRTIRRTWTGEELWSGNRETWKGSFFSRDSLFLWALQTYPRYQKEFPALFARPEHAHLQVIHLRSRAETDRWLAWLTSQPPNFDTRSKS